jgi:hypothetical protein
MPYIEQTGEAHDAKAILDLWERYMSAHVPVGGSCSCGKAHVVLTLRDFEQDIGDYLQIEAEKYQRQDVKAFLITHGRDGEEWSVPNILTALCEASNQPEPHVAEFLLGRLERTIRSFEGLHGRR